MRVVTATVTVMLLAVMVAVVVVAILLTPTARCVTQATDRSNGRRTFSRPPRLGYEASTQT